jgi:ferrous iron transport protein B
MRERAPRRARAAGTWCRAEPASVPHPSGGPVRVALAGNPNVGKSSLFNGLTGANQQIGNWPGKTVERRNGTCRRGALELLLTDLPGTYSLAASSPEEVVAEAALTSGEHDVVAVVLDSTNLERNLYLAVQLAELGAPLVLVLNLVDAAACAGLTIDDTVLGDAFGAPVVRTVARSGEGLDELAATLAAVGGRRRREQALERPDALPQERADARPQERATDRPDGRAPEQPAEAGAA